MAIAQLNVAESLAPLDDPLMQEFVSNLERINLLAENSPGFQWRLKDDDGDGAVEQTYPGMANSIFNMSVWDSAEDLFHYVYETDHLAFLQRKKEWFHKLKSAHMVFWEVSDGHQPTLEEAINRLNHLRHHGESEHAFTFKWLRQQQKAKTAEPIESV